MSVKRALQIMTVLFLVFLLSAVLSLYGVYRTTVGKLSSAGLLGEVFRGVFELSILTADYELHPGERDIRQWHARHESLGLLLKQLSRADREDAAVLAEIAADHKDTGVLFDALAGSANGTAAGKASRELLAGQLQARMQAMVSAAIQLKRINQSRLLTSYRASSLFLIALVAAASVAMAAGTFSLGRHILRSLERIREGTENVAGGNLAFRLRLGRADEIGKLAEAFDRMAERLEAARDRLTREMDGRTRAEETLRESEERFRRAVNHFPGTFILYDSRRRIQLVNAHGILVAGRPESELLGRTDEELFPPEVTENYLPALRLALETRAPQTFETQAALLPDRERALIVSYVPLLGRGGEVREILGITYDITDRKRAEERLRLALAELARSNADLRQFAYAASHDLQEPLRSISSFTQLLDRRYKGRLGPEADEFLSFIVEGAVRMQTLIEDLLAYSRVGTHGKAFGPSDCEAALDKALSNVRASLEASGAVVTRDALPVVRGDDSQLVQLFQNLLSNAVKFRRECLPRIHVSSRHEADEWVFSVRDNGIGIDPRHAVRIFVMFQRLHARQEYPGTGVGLAVCKRIVERHGGRIWVESQPGEGSTFRFTIPTGEVQGP